MLLNQNLNNLCFLTYHLALLTQDKQLRTATRREKLVEGKMNIGCQLKDTRLGCHAASSLYPAVLQIWAMRYLIVAFLMASGQLNAEELTQPPETRIEIVVDRMHGVDIPDPYRWLEDQQSPETRDWITAQNAYTRAILDAVPGRKQLREQLEKLSRVDFQSAPTVSNGRYFFTRRGAEQDQRVIVVREGLDGPERVLIDPMTLNPDGSVSVGIMDVTPGGRMLAWEKSAGGKDEVEVFFLDVDSGQLLTDRLPRGLYYDVFILPDRSGFLYARRRADGMRVLEHRFGTRIEEDRELFGTGLKEDKLIWLEFSEDGRFVVAFVTGSGVYVLDRSQSTEFQPLITDVPDRFTGGIGGHTLFLQTTWNAPNGRVLAIDLENPARENWREVIPPSKDSVIRRGVWPVGGKILVSFLRNVTSRLAVFEPDGKLVRDISLPTLGTGSLRGGSWGSDEAFYGFRSFAHPETTYRYNVVTGKQSIWHQSSVPVKSETISTRQVWYRSKDGTRIPMFVVSKKGTKLDGNRPTLLSGYGGYGAISMPYFNETVAIWVDQGGVYAQANIRGGGEFGEEWHRDGMLENKQNSFDDFIAAAEWLVANDYTRPAKLAISGRSNGALLVGAVATQRPDLFRAVICGVPHLDMLRYHKFLKAAPWVHEYGNPDVAEEFEYLRRYSPYHQVRDGEHYPAMLFTTGDGDTRVAPLHARKMTARMQAASQSGLPIMLRYDFVAGHSGRSGGLSHRLDRIVDQMAFLNSQLGLTP